MNTRCACCGAGSHARLKKCPTCGEFKSNQVAAKAKKPKWEYSRYRATLKRDGVTFAIVTPDGRNALKPADVRTLLDALNT